LQQRQQIFVDQKVGSTRADIAAGDVGGVEFTVYTRISTHWTA